MAIAKPRKLWKKFKKKIFPASEKPSPGQMDFDVMEAIRKRKKSLKDI